MAADRPNIPVPDQLASLRDRIKHLQTQEAELRDALIANPDIREGNNWIAEVKEIETSRVDLKELRAMHKDLVEEYTFPQRTVRIELSAIDADTGEILSPQRKAAQRRKMTNEVLREWLKDNPGRSHLDIPAAEFLRRRAAKESPNHE